MGDSHIITKRKCLRAHYYLFLLVFLLNTSTIFSQTPFCGTIGGGAGAAQSESIIQSSDGSYVVAGATTSFGAGSYDLYIVKFNALGVVQWTRTVGGAGFDLASSIIQTADGGYVVGGTTFSYGTGSNFYIVKLDGAGVVQWTRTVGLLGGEIGLSLAQTTDGSYVLVGSTASTGAGGNDLYVVKLNGIGVVQWTRTVGGVGEETGRSIVQTTDGGCAITGPTTSFGVGGNDLYVVKLNGAGVVEWTRTVGGLGEETGSSIVQTADGGYAMAGNTDSFGAGSNDFYVVKLNSAGVVEWTRTVGGLGSDIASSIVQTTDGGYAVFGYTNSFGVPNLSSYLIKLDAAGAIMFTKTYGYGAGDLVVSYSGTQTTSGGYALVGISQISGVGLIHVIITDATGTSCCENGSGGVAGSGGVSGSGGASSSGGVSGVGGSFSSGGAFTAICPANLPVKLLAFTGKSKGVNNLLEWQTASEINNDYFSVEKSADGISWQLVDRTNGAGNSNSMLSYSMIDDNPLAVTYYRLKQTDFDGKYEYSKTIVVKRVLGLGGINIYPNPATNTLNISGEKLNVSNIHIINILGEDVTRARVNLKLFSDSEIVFDISALSNGIYMIRIATDTGSMIEKIIKE